MPDVEIICPSCGQTFVAKASQPRAFCVHCGTLVDRSAEIDPPERPAEVAAASPKELQYKAAKAAFEAVRFKVLDPKKDLRGDLLIGLWSMLLFHAQNSNTKWSINRARKDIGGFFLDKKWAQALEQAGDQRSRLIASELLDSADVFLKTCRDDSKYGSRLMGVMRMQPQDIARKAANDMLGTVIRYLLKIGEPGESAAIIHAIVMGYPRAFPDYRQLFADEMADTLTQDERATVLARVAAIAPTI
jgi:hypothetical protein